MIAKQDRLAGIPQLGDQEPEDEGVLFGEGGICEQLRAVRTEQTRRRLESTSYQTEYQRPVYRPVEPETESDP